MDALPESGRLAAHPLPRLLLRLWRERFDGVLCMSREQCQKRIYLREGVPVFSESNLASESLGIQLMDAGTLSREDYSRVVERVSSDHCKEGSALLALKLLEPKQLFLALKDQLRRRVLECFAWADGDFALESGEPPGADAQAFRVEPAALVQEGLATHWSTDRTLEQLSPHLQRFPRTTPRFDALAQRNQDKPELANFLNGLDGKTCFGEVISKHLSPEVLGLAWVAAETALEFADTPLQDAEPEAENDEPELEPEIDVVVAGEDEALAPNNATTPASSAEAAKPTEASPEAQALRDEILDKHARLDELDHYQMLGVEHEASQAQIKRAYFKLAKRAHPDQLARLGLEEIREQTNEFFACVSKAYEVLGNPVKRQEYDRSDDGEAEVDVNKVAQAESLYLKGEILMKAGNFAGALEYLRPCVELWPDEADYQAALGWSLFKSSPSDPDGARTHLEEALRRKEKDPQLMFRLGTVLGKLGDEERSKQLTADAKAIDPKIR